MSTRHIPYTVKETLPGKWTARAKIVHTHAPLGFIVETWTIDESWSHSRIQTLLTGLGYDGVLVYTELEVS